MSTFDIKIEGRGMWFMIHTLALHANTDELKGAFILTINTLYENFGCESCKPHFRKFLDDYPIKNYWHIKYKGEDYGFFKWSWDFHNDVNKRLKKPILSFEDVLFRYKNYVCKNCDKKINNPILVEVKEKEPYTLNLLSNY